MKTMTITPDTVESRAAGAPSTIAPRATTPGPIGPHPDESVAPTAAAMSPSDHLFAEGIALLDAGDHLAAAEKVWQAAVTAMVSYSDVCGWQPQDWHLHRKLLDIVKLRSEELGMPYLGPPSNPNPIVNAYVAADSLEAHVAQDGHFLDLPEVRRLAERVRPLLDIFRLD